MIARKDIESLIGSGFFLFIATLIVNAANYGLNLILGRVLGPELYAEANMIATLVMILSFIAMGLQLTVAKLYAEGQEKLVGLLHKRVKVLSYLLVRYTTISLDEYGERCISREKRFQKFSEDLLGRNAC